MRIATYNVQSFDRLFGRDGDDSDDDGGDLLDDDGPSGRYGISRRRQTAALGAVFHALDADAVMVIEAPDERREQGGVPALETFARHFKLRARKGVTGFPSDTRQEITLLHDPDALQARHDSQADGVARFDETFLLDLNEDGHPDTIRWSKPPLEVAVTTARGTPLRLIGVHAKSKAVHGARDSAHATRIGIDNRRKQLAQCVWLRARVDRHLAAGEATIVLGDFNDGPGIDEVEALFGRSGVEIVLGEGNAVRLFDPSARVVSSRRTLAAPTTARFRLPPDDEGEARWLSALLDYVMVTPDLRERRPRWRIWHPFDDPACYADEALRDALLAASDHFPVTLDLDV